MLFSLSKSGMVYKKRCKLKKGMEIGMDDIRALVNRLIAYTSEEDWFEFKDSWYDAVGIGEYISSMSNVAAMCGKESAYVIWGVDNNTHGLTNTSFDYRKDVKGEPLEHFLARQITPDINFRFEELSINEKRIVVFRIFFCSCI